MHGKEPVHSHGVMVRMEGEGGPHAGADWLDDPDGHCITDNNEIAHDPSCRT